MTVAVTPHLNFRGKAREALEFYQSVFGGNVSIVSYSDAGIPGPDQADHVVWGQVAAENGFRLMAHDVYPGVAWSPGEDPFFVSVGTTGIEDLQGFWDRLTDGATVRQPLGPSQWATAYGMLTDRFGITWVLDTAGDPE